MGFFLTLAFLFAIGSMIGWVLEFFYRRLFMPEHKWVNPGFLMGPYLPLYGISLIILFLLSQLEAYILIDNECDALRKLLLFVAMAICITVVEYFTGLLFIVKLNIKLWDYTNNKFNIKGVICPRYSFYWMILSALYYFLINPRIENTLFWLSQNLAFSFFIGAFFGVFAIDLVVSIRNLLKIHEFAISSDVIIRIEEFKADIVNYKEQ
ncbi:MAG: putative ABC transporter permease [Ruminococcus sp.]|nr:putative ABC transporter permease [Ruminococcus sp.]